MKNMAAQSDKFSLLRSSKVRIEYLTMRPINIIQSILFQLNGDLTSMLEQHISKEFDALVKITSPLNDNQLPLIDKNRRQWKSDNILLWI